MKIKIVFKDPDAVTCGVDDAVGEYIKNSEDLAGEVNADELASVVKRSIEKWIEWEEYITIVIDTEQQTATVLEVGE